MRQSNNHNIVSWLGLYKIKRMACTRETHPPSKVMKARLASEVLEEAMLEPSNHLADSTNSLKEN